MGRAAVVVTLLWIVAAYADQSYVVRRIDVIGLHRTKRWVVERELRFQVGDTVTAKDLHAASDRLSNLSIFNSVSVHISRGGVVAVRAPELWPLWPVLGVSFSEGKVSDLFTRPRAFLRRATLSAGGTYLNTFGTGARLYGVGQIGATQGIDLEYHSRWFSQHLPVAVRLGFTDLRENSSAPVSYDSTRYRRDLSGTVDVSTHEGAPSRVGLKLKYRDLRVQTTATGGGSFDLLRRYQTMWFSPYVILDRRDLEWFPSRGAYAETRVDLVTGNIGFIRSMYDYRAYFPFHSTVRSPLIALRLAAGTSTNSTPKWAHYYYSFGNALRGFGDLRSESGTYIIGNAELRYPLGDETTYDVPLIGRYGKNWPWGVSALAFVERGELILAGSRAERTGFGAGFYFRIPYFEILETSATLRPSGHTSFSVSTGVAF
ncbi:MAG TPA: BamA/TamA family outer membrane protein [bacterium]|jgi:outer membrane protein assembly factor BamA